MREVSACDFCDASDAGTFEVLPPSIDGGESSEASRASPDASASGGGRRMVLCDDCRSTLGGVLQPLLDRVDPDRDVEPTAAGAGSAGSTADVAGAAGRADGGARAAEAGGGQSAAGGDAEEDDAGGSDDSDDGGAKMAATGAGTSSGVPRGYRKVIRFLENREFPLERENAVSMTSDAYDLDEEAVDAAIDHAIKHERLKEFDGELGKA